MSPRTLERIRTADGLVGYRSPALAAVGVPHLFTTRIDGAPGRELDFAALGDDQHHRVTHAAGRKGAALVFVRQVHGADVITLRAGERPPADAKADALVSERPDAFIGIHVADCVPVLLAREDGRRVAAVHAGWRGLVAGVLPRAIEALGDGRILAAIGPCISRDRFEVGPEVEEAFAAAGLDSVIHSTPHGRARIDLREAALRQLNTARVERIETSERCTYGDVAELYSYRREVTHGDRPRTGRLAALITTASGP